MTRQAMLNTVFLVMSAMLAGTPAYATVISINSAGQVEVQDAPNYLQKEKNETHSTTAVQQSPSAKRDTSSLLVTPLSLGVNVDEGSQISTPVRARIISPATLAAEKQDANPTTIEPEEEIDSINVEVSPEPQEARVSLPSTAKPRVAKVIKKPKLFADYVEQEAAKYEKIDIAMIEAVIEAESNYNELAVSSKGAMGLMQLMPATATTYGVVDAFDPAQNIKAGTAELARLMDVYDNNLALALAAYNAGETAVKKYDGIPPYDETQNYVVKILSKILHKQAAVLKSKNLADNAAKLEQKPKDTSQIESNEIRHMKVYTFNF